MLPFPDLKKHFEVSFRVRPSSGIKSRGNPPGNFSATYRMCHLIPDYYPRTLFHRYNELWLCQRRIKYAVGEEKYPYPPV